MACACLATGTATAPGSFGPILVTVPRARLVSADGTTREWKCTALRSYQRRTQAADALIASAYLAGTNTRRARRALADPSLPQFYTQIIQNEVA